MWVLQQPTLRGSIAHKRPYEVALWLKEQPSYSYIPLKALFILSFKVLSQYTKCSTNNLDLNRVFVFASVLCSAVQSCNNLNLKLQGLKKYLSTKTEDCITCQHIQYFYLHMLTMYNVDRQNQAKAAVLINLQTCVSHNICKIVKRTILHQIKEFLSFLWRFITAPVLCYFLCRVEGEADAGKEKLVLSQECHLVTLMTAVKGRFDITTTHVYFHDLSPVKEDLDRQDFKVLYINLPSLVDSTTFSFQTLALMYLLFNNHSNCLISSQSLHYFEVIFLG